MPTTTTRKRAQAKKRAGKAPSTQAGEYVKEEMHKLKRGKGNAQTRKQAIAIGLSEARQSGVKIPKAPKSRSRKSRGTTPPRARKRTTSKK